MNQLITTFMALIKSEICACPLDGMVAKQISPSIVPKLYAIAKKHDLTHLIAFALDRQGLLEEDEHLNPFLKGVFNAVKKQERAERTRKAMYEMFEEEEIPFVPLKGAVLEALYSQAWMRTRCDTDILVREADLTRAKEQLVSKLGYEFKEKKYHDIWLRSPEKVDVELHFSLLEHKESLDKVLSTAWDYILPMREGGYEHRMTPEFLLFHLLAHMSYHFMKGGCGIRSVIDVWLLKRQGGYDEAKLRVLCEEAGIGTFATYVFRLAEVWFEDGAHDDISRKMERYIITNGTYGSKKSKVMATRIHKKGKLKYIWSRMFLPREDLSILFPQLKERPYLYTYYSVKHWGKVVRTRAGKAVIREMKLNQEMKQESVDELEGLFGQLGL